MKVTYRSYNFSHGMHDGFWNWKFAKLSIVFIFLELKFVMFAVQVFWYWSENCSFQTGKELQRLRMLRTGGSQTLYGVLNVFEFLYFLILFLFLLLFLFYSILFYSILFYSILFYSILLYSILFYSILFYSILFYSILFFSILFCSILFYLSPHGIIYIFSCLGKNF